MSNNSGSLPSGRLSALSQHSDRGGNKSDSESEEESSDWDSWDEEPEVRSSLYFYLLQVIEQSTSSGHVAPLEHNKIVCAQWRDNKYKFYSLWYY